MRTAISLVMPMHVDDRTQVQLVALRAEAQVLKSWMARRADVAARRRDGPLQAARQRLALLEREVPRLDLEVRSVERRLGSVSTRTPIRTFCLGLLRGGLVVLAAAAWVIGVATVTPTARVDDPFRLLALGLLVATTLLSRHGRARS